MEVVGNEHFEYFREDFLCEEPSIITVHNAKSGDHITEPSYVAMKIETGLQGRRNISGPPLAVGRKALSYQGAPDMVVFSPFRQGQVAQWGLAADLLRALMKQVTPKLLLKPDLYIRRQQQTTQVEERALIDLGLRSGAHRVHLYDGSISRTLEHISENKSMRNAFIIHIEPQT